MARTTHPTPPELEEPRAADVERHGRFLRDDAPVFRMDTAPRPARSFSERPVPPPPPPPWQGEIAGMTGIVFSAGLWLLFAPFVLGYTGEPAAGHDVALGAAIVVVSFARLVLVPRGAWLSWASVGLGAWVFAAAFWLADSSLTTWNEAIVGALVLLFAAGSASASDTTRADIGDPHF